MAAPMFLCSGPDYVVESCRAGIVGTFPCLNQRTTEGYEAWLLDIRRRLQGSHAAPFGAMMPVASGNARFDADLAVTVKYEVPIVVTALGTERSVIDAIHSYGGLVFHDATVVRHAKKALDAGVDAIIAVSAGAGGHAGTYNPLAFLSELRPLVANRMLILAGAVSNGRSVAAGIAAGADLVSVGTALMTTVESTAMPEQKRMIFESTVKDIIYTAELSGMPANFLRQTVAPALAIHGKSSGFDIERELSPKLWKDVWTAGHGVGALNEEITIAEFCRRMEADYRGAMDRVASALQA